MTNSDDVDRVEQAIIEAIREVGVEQHGTDLTLPTRAMAEAALRAVLAGKQGEQS